VSSKYIFSKSKRKVNLYVTEKALWNAIIVGKPGCSRRGWGFASF
jgi:hypothetical protein